MGIDSKDIKRHTEAGCEAANQALGTIIFSEIKVVEDKGELEPTFDITLSGKPNGKRWISNLRLVLDQIETDQTIIQALTDGITAAAQKVQKELVVRKTRHTPMVEKQDIDEKVADLQKKERDKREAIVAQQAAIEAGYNEEAIYVD